MVLECEDKMDYAMVKSEVSVLTSVFPQEIQKVSFNEALQIAQDIEDGTASQDIKFYTDGKFFFIEDPDE